MALTEGLPVALLLLHLLLLAGNPATANEARCRKDCRLPINTTHAEWEVGPNPRYELTLSFLGGVDTYRPIGPTRPPHTRGHPWFPHDHELTNPSKYSKFCEAGCTFFFAEHRPPSGGIGHPLVPEPDPLQGGLEGLVEGEEVHEYGSSNVTCKRLCDTTYKYDVSVGYSDLAEVARYECYDGCDIALLRCQPGYFCQWPSTTGVAAEANWDKAANMTPCSPGTYRPEDYLHVSACFECPPGRYREEIKGRRLGSCNQCPAARYVNATGSASHTACLRCPAGRFSSLPGAGLCECITAWSCGDEKAYKRDATFEGCNAASQECGTQNQRQTYSTMRKVSQYHLCRDKDMFKRRAGQDLYDVATEVTALDSNKEVYCGNYLDGDFNYDMQQLVTKVEERSADGVAFDATPPAGFF